MLATLTRSIAAAGELLQQVCCTAFLGSPAVTLIEERIYVTRLPQERPSATPPPLH